MCAYVGSSKNPKGPKGAHGVHKGVVDDRRLLNYGAIAPTTMGGGYIRSCERAGSGRGVLGLQGYLTDKKLPPYSTTMPRLLWRSYGWGAFSYGRDTPAEFHVLETIMSFEVSSVPLKDGSGFRV